MNKIAELNDKLRQNIFNPGKDKVILTRGVSNLPFDEQLKILIKVKDFNDFTPDNNPWGENDFGKLEHNNTDYFWKIDYYNRDMDAGSDDPSNPDITTRVLTIMRADEY